MHTDTHTHTQLYTVHTVHTVRTVHTAQQRLHHINDQHYTKYNRLWKLTKTIPLKSFCSVRWLDFPFFFVPIFFCSHHCHRHTTVRKSNKFNPISHNIMCVFVLFLDWRMCASVIETNTIVKIATFSRKYVVYYQATTTTNTYTQTTRENETSRFRLERQRKSRRVNC